VINANAINAKEAVRRARQHGVVVPAYNIPFLPMMKPVIQAVVDENSIAMVQVARLEWNKFGSQSLEAVAQEYNAYRDPLRTLLHLDHVPVIDEDLQEVDYLPILQRGIDAGYQSVMIDASRLDFGGNLAATQSAVAIAHKAGVPCEAELGAVMGHESGPAIPYDEIFATKKGFTNLQEAARFVQESGCDWLSVAVGSVHGAVAESLKFQKKPEAKLDIAHIQALYEATGIPLVLHGGSGIKVEYIRRGIEAGIAKINVATEIRQAYLRALEKNPHDIPAAQEAVYQSVREITRDFLGVSGTRALLYP